MSFSRKTLEFLTENRLQNNKIWFDERKTDYQQYVLEPFKELVTLLAPVMLEIDPLFITEPKVDRTISRIYRDTRFSKDKSLYRDTMWCVFMRDKKIYNGLPGYFFEITPNGFDYGCGYYQASTESMDSFRKLIINDDNSFLNALKTYEKQGIFKIEGESYKKSKYAEKPANLRNWLDRKTIYLIAYSSDYELLFSDKLSAKLSADFKLIKPIYDFLCKVEANK